VQILGCSFDSVEENRRFAERRGYPFPLLSDVDRRIGLAYAACDAADAPFPRRISYLIDEEGRIDRVFAKVNPLTHAAEVLSALDA